MKRILNLITLALGVLLVALIVDFVRHSSAQERAAISQGLATTESLRTDIDATLQQVMRAGHDLADQLEASDFSEAEIIELVKTRSREMPAILGVTVAYEPFAFQPEKNFSPPTSTKTKTRSSRLKNCTTIPIGA